jgi:hypothetical protein
MSRKPKSKAGRAHYARRKAIVEPAFGQIKEARGFRGSSLRGLEAVQAEWMLVVAVHNLGKLFGAAGAGRVLPGGPRQRGGRPDGPPGDLQDDTTPRRAALFGHPASRTPALRAFRASPLAIRSTSTAITDPGS